MKPTSPPVTSYDPCAGGLALTAPTREAGCGCGCGGAGGCRTGASAPTRTYGDCPPWKPSCETQTAVRDCAKVALCDLLRCVSETLCPDGQFDVANFQTGNGGRPLGEQLVNCLGQALCSFMHCLPEALCPEPCAPATPVDCLPCGYAVEVVR
ncbi:MAG: hypothetical protein R3B06_04725 [Kofleriaceae bacterium]